MRSSNYRCRGPAIYLAVLTFTLAQASVGFVVMLNILRKR
jgi:hypothetical protein